jgi:hypothetical protein
MRLMLGAAAAALLFATPVLAQTDTTTAAPASCGAVTPQPADMPDGASASRSAVEAFTTRFNAWAEANNQALACKRARAEAARAQADAYTAEFNTENAALRASIAAWQAEVNEFNARNVAQERRPAGDPRSREN